MKTCTKCNGTKPEEDFYWFNKEHTQREWRCKACCIAAKRRHEKENPEHAANVLETRKRLQGRNREFITRYLSEHPCVDCGETDIQVLQFDHVIPVLGSRKRRVSNYARQSASIGKIQEEIDKCEIRCANCHMRRTRKQFGWTLTL